MSTLQESATLGITTTDNDLLNCFVKSENARNTENICEEKSSIKKENSENLNGSLSATKREFKNDSTQRTLKFETFADLMVNTQRPSAVDENPLKILSEDKDNFDNKPIIDIKPSILQQENFVSDRAHLTRRFSDFVKSLCILCDICDNQNTERVIRLNRQERIVAAVILRKSFGIGIKTIKIFPNKFPEQFCGSCFKKIILFHQRFKSQRKIKKEFNRDMDQPPHGYQCQCLTCQNQYGSLPVLLKGIEEQNKMQSSDVLSSGYHQETNVPICQPQITFQSHQVDIVTCQMQPQISFQDPLLKFDEDFKSFQSQQQGNFQTSLTSSQGYSHFSSSQETNYPNTSKTELYLELEQSRSDYQAPVGDQSQLGPSYSDQSQYYESSSVHRDPSYLSSSSYSQDQHLPTLLQDLERTCEMSNQPSTSGLQGQSWAQDDKHSKKIMTCEHCNKSFTHKGDFNKHLRKHTKEKPYNCAHCDKSFSHTSNLHRHQRIHSGDRPFQCQYCDKRFSRKDKLESHKNSKSCKTKRSWK